MKGFSILPNARRVSSPTENSSRNGFTLSGLSSVVIMSQEASAASADVPSLSSAIPTPTPTANRIAMLSISALPAFTRNIPSIGIKPAASPPCIVEGHIKYPSPINMPHSGRQATGSMIALPSFCKNFMFPFSPHIPTINNLRGINNLKGVFSFEDLKT